MARSRAVREIEIKLEIPSASAGRSLLRKAGFRISRRRHHEDNLVFDFAGGALRSSGVLLRLRTVGGAGTVTLKQAIEGGKHKSRLEVETAVGDASNLAAILEGVGLRAVFRYEKHRTEYQEGGRRGTVVLDETPVGVFLELEGSPKWIDDTARRLGFAERDYICKSYGQLFEERRRRCGLGRHMVFPARLRGKLAAPLSPTSQ